MYAQSAASHAALSSVVLSMKERCRRPLRLAQSNALAPDWRKAPWEGRKDLCSCLR
jgi:hypothetical protein